MKGILFRVKKEAMMGAGKARLEKNDDMVGRWKYTDIVLGPKLPIIDVCFLLNCPKFASLGRYNACPWIDNIVIRTIVPVRKFCQPVQKTYTSIRCVSCILSPTLCAIPMTLKNCWCIYYSYNYCNLSFFKLSIWL